MMIYYYYLPIFLLYIFDSFDRRVENSGLNRSKNTAKQGGCPKAWGDWTHLTMKNIGMSI